MLLFVTLWMLVNSHRRSADTNHLRMPNFESRTARHMNPER